ncbi:MAG TPA: TIGR00725 family protein [Thermodesulfovibrionales bacterium]|nr:TIGR00725 family protein [Thermodesulfovibrionales bacterium]
MKQMIGVIGAGKADEETMKVAEAVGKGIAGMNAVVICGGLGGVMEAAARGAHAAGGITVGILPRDRKEEANPSIDVAIATGFGEGRNVLIVRSAEALIAVGGEYGTLSEIALALKTGKPVVGIGTWDIPGVVRADDAEDAVRKVFDILRAR